MSDTRYIVTLTEDEMINMLYSSLYDMRFLDKENVRYKLNAGIASKMMQALLVLWEKQGISAE